MDNYYFYRVKALGSLKNHGYQMSYGGELIVDGVEEEYSDIFTTEEQDPIKAYNQIYLEMCESYNRRGWEDLKVDLLQFNRV